MPSDDDLSSIPGLEANHRRGLARKLGITSVRALADADPDTVYTDLRTTAARASRQRIEEWQREARSRLSDAENDWPHAASFAVVFAQRRVNGDLERRLEVGQTEAGPPGSPSDMARLGL